MAFVAVFGATVTTNHDCDTQTTAGQGSSKVLINGKGIARHGDPTVEHLQPTSNGCDEHIVYLRTSYSKVQIRGDDGELKGIGRVGDFYGDDEEITDAGQSKVNAG